MTELDTIYARVQELDERITEIMESDRPARVKLIRVTHVRKELQALLTMIPEIENAYSSRS